MGHNHLTPNKEGIWVMENTTSWGRHGGDVLCFMQTAPPKARPSFPLVSKANICDFGGHFFLPGLRR